jgi:beta-glucosidase
MQNRSPLSESRHKASRREFLATMTLAAGALAAGLPGTTAAAKMAAPGLAAGRRAGISDAAYRRAWKRAQALVARMNLEEKITQTNAWAAEVKRIGLPAYIYYAGEGLHGLAMMHGVPEPVVIATSFPVPLSLAASWNPDLFQRVYSAVADEARAYDNRYKSGLVFYSPVTLNLHRDPRWGRCDEAPGEDPCLAATLAVKTVRGMQGDHPAYLKATACTKHFACNNTDDDRKSVSATVEARDFWEYYTRAERATVMEADVFLVMSAYNSLNGVPCSANHFLLTELLRNRWGFRGFVASDCDAIENIFDPHHFVENKVIAAALAVQAGCDSNCGGTLQANLKPAVDQGLISEAKIDLALTRVLTVRHLLGEFDERGAVPYSKIPFSVVDSPKHRALALEAARQSLVLLKNDSGFLPLKKSHIRKIAVIGPFGGMCNLGGYSGMPGERISPVDGIAEALGVKVRRSMVLATDMVSSHPDIHLEACAEGGFHLRGNANSWVEFPKLDFTGRTDLQIRLSSEAKDATIEARLDQLNGPVAFTLTVSATGGWQKWQDVSVAIKNISGEHSMFLRFLAGSGDVATVQRLELHPVCNATVESGGTEVVFNPGCTVLGPKDEKMFQDAVAAARSADVVVLVCGINTEVCREELDRKTIGLTGAQPELVQAVYAANPKTVLVISANNTVAVNWEQEHLPAIVAALCAGQAQGRAIAEVLFGACNPGGKLPCTWYRSVEQLPPAHDYSLRKGRTYLYFQGEPLYPFGHGLSYTTFQFDQFKMSGDRLGPDGHVKVSLAVTNTGKHAGAEVVQFYLTPPPSPVPRPKQQLAGFQRVELQPGERKTVIFDLPFTEPAFWYWDEKQNHFTLHPGKARILVGNSSANILLSGELNLEASDGKRMELEQLNSVAVPVRITRS